MRHRIIPYCLSLIAFLGISLSGMQGQTVTFTPTNVTCNGANNATMKMDLTGGSSTYWYVSYNVTNPAESDSIGPTTLATYTFTDLKPSVLYLFYVRDNVTGDYVGSQTNIFTQPAVLNATVASTNVNCNGGSTGTITISSPTGGSGAYEYTINGGGAWQSSGSFTGLAAGSYNVQMRDKNAPACTKVLNVALSITQLAALNASVASTDVTCFGKANGTITVSAPTGGSGSYQYSRNGGTSWQASGSFTALAPGTYNVVMRDATYPTCTMTLNAALVISQPAQLQVSDISIIKGLTCNDGSDGQLRALVSGGTTPYSYSWYVNNAGSWVSISQTAQTAVNLPQGWYEVRVNDANNCGVPTPATAREFFIAGATDSIPPAFVFDSASVVNTCQGQTNGSLTLYAHGGISPFTYSITTGGASGYQSSNSFTNLAAGTYQTWAMDKKGCKKSGPSKTIATTPNAAVSVSITANPSGAICPATSVQFTATPVNGGTTPAYQWKLNGANVGTGAATYTNAALANGDQVVVVLTSSLRCTSGNPATSNIITASLLTPPSISVQPASLSQCAGTNATFSVTAAGSGITYQWKKGGTAISGATNASYTINNIASGDAAGYTVTITGTCGTITSNAATLTVNAAPAITTQPVSLTQCAGSNATFSVTATGAGLTYQWRKGGVNIGGATNASYTLNNITAADAASYTVVITGTCGTLTSNAATLTVNAAPAITVQPVALTRCTGTAAAFSVTATGAGLTYQWRKGGTNIAGATNSSYSIASVAVGDAGNYDVVVTGTCGTVTSSAVSLTVNTAPSITTQPVSLTQCAGTNATFSVTATGTALTYQWQKGGTNIGGATNASYTLNNISAADAGSYTVVLSGTCGTLTSNAATLTVNPLTAITVQPVALTRCTGTAAAFSVTATGAGLTYQWRKGGTNISGATNSSYSIASVVIGDAANYDVVVTGTCGSVTSAAVALTVNTAPAITTQPVSLTQCAGTNVTLSVTATGTALTYQWQKGGVNIGGATNASYTLNNISAADAGSYTVVLTGTCGTLTSNAATLTVNAAPAITGQPAPVAGCTGTPATFTVTATGAGLTYQWRKGGTNISGATNASYTIASLAAGDAGNYDVVVTGTCGSVTSNTAALTVNTAPSITTQPVSLTQCAGTPATFSVTATGAGLTYQWRKGSTNISGATNASYTIASIGASDAASYTVVITGTCGTATSNAATLTVNTAPSISGQPVSVTQCAGTNATFTVTASGTALTYQWRKNGTAISGATSASYTLNNISAADAASYTVVLTGTCGTLTSVAAVLTVTPATSITTQPVALNQCAGTNATFTVTAAGASLTYQWRKNGTAIGGATNASYTINNIAAGDAGNYTVQVSGTCGVAISNAAALTILQPPSITAQPADLTRCAGTNGSFTVTATGPGLTYQWQKDAANIGGATNASYTVNNIAAGDAGSYRVIVTGTCGSVTSNAANLTVAQVPQITGQPVGDEVCEGADVSLSVTATGTGITYQWRKDGSAIAGKTTATLSLPAITPAQAGNYDVLVYGMCDTLTSDAATVIVNPAAAVTWSDDDTLVCEGSTVDFNITANGSGTNTYQWQWQYMGNWIDLSDGGDISGVSTPDLQVKNAEAADTGYYRCVVTSACGSAVSDSMNLRVNVIVATIGTPAPFLIDSTSTVIRVGVKVTDRFLNWDLGFSLVAPDGTEVMLKAPLTFPCVFNPFNDGVDATFTNEIDKATGDTIDYCDNIKIITGTFAATGNWNVLHGMDPANGAWQVRIYDADKSVPDPDGFIKLATLSFTDLDMDGDTAVITYNSGLINEGIVNPIGGELKPTSFVVPIRLMTTCFNTEDARAVVTVKGGIAPFTYQWTGPTTEPALAQVDLGAGTYSVTVTDAMGCSAVATVEVTAPPAIVFTDVKVADTLACFESTNGSIRALANGGYGTLTYTLNPGNLPTAVADSAVFLNLGGGSYTLHVTDVNGCSLDSVRTIATRPQLQAVVTVVPVIGQTKGSINITATGGTAPYQYSIDGGATLVDTNGFDSLNVGVYHVYVEDANGCTFTKDVSLAVNALAVNVVKHDISCFGASDGDFLLTTTDGVGPYTLTGSWLSEAYITVDGLISFTGQSGGRYDIQLVDSEGKMYIDTIDILEPSEIVAVGDITDATCSALTKDGAIALTVSGGSSPYSFAWTGGATTEDLDGVEAGHYEVVITDDNDCSATFGFDITGLNVATADAGSDATICPGAEYQLLGNTGDSVHWEPAALADNPDISNPWVSIMTSTDFILTVYQNGCADKDTVALTALERIGMDIYDPSGETDIDTALYLLEGESHPMAATPGFTSYRWQPGTWLSDTTTEAVVTTPLDNIYYTVYGTTADGCIETDRVHVILARKIEVFTGFSPNGDGINDTWVIKHAAEYGERIRVKVFNRWGEPVFESKGYGGSAEWDGTRNGKPLPVGAYYFIIDVDDGKSKPYTGTITILR